MLALVLLAARTAGRASPLRSVPAKAMDGYYVSCGGDGSRLDGLLMELFAKRYTHFHIEEVFRMTPHDFKLIIASRQLIWILYFVI